MGAGFKALLARFRIDPYILALLATVALASFLPARGGVAHGVSISADLAVALLFFLHGAKLSREAITAGMTNWKLHLAVLASTFVLFPVLGLLTGFIPQSLLPTPLAMGLLYLCCLPSTVQSSIAFTSIAKGDVAAAVCSASASSLLGMFITPLLVGALMHAHGGFSFTTLRDIALQLLLPFILGQVVRKWVIGWIDRHKSLVGYVDRGSILLVVYSAFSEAVVRGIWKQVTAPELLVTGVVCAALLLVVLFVTMRTARLMGLSKEEEITVVFCGSKKSLVAGAPMAAILFPPAIAGVMILPLMLFHQIQLMACAYIAQKYAQRLQEPPQAG